MLSTLTKTALDWYTSNRDLTDGHHSVFYRNGWYTVKGLTIVNVTNLIYGDVDECIQLDCGFHLIYRFDDNITIKSEF